MLRILRSVGIASLPIVIRYHMYLPCPMPGLPGVLSALVICFGVTLLVFPVTLRNFLLRAMLHKVMPCKTAVLVRRLGYIHYLSMQLSHPDEFTSTNLLLRDGPRKAGLILLILVYPKLMEGWDSQFSTKSRFRFALATS